MTDKIIDFIRQNDMISLGDTVVCGLSGGADSVCLLLSMLEISSSLGFSVEAVHVNHCIRGRESDRDQQFCQELCQRLGVPLTVNRCDVPQFSKENSLSLEEAARKMRYQVFSEVSAGKKLATAHNANDNLETMILNLARGTGLKGICGVPPVRENIIRPLLTVSRQEIEEFLSSRGQDFVTDSTNLELDCTRNIIRHKIMPVLSEINGSAVQTAVSSAETLRSENQFIEQQVNSAYITAKNGTCLENIRDLHPVIRRRCIARLLTENHLPYSHQRLEDADHVLINGGKLNISGNWFLIGKSGSLWLAQILPHPDSELAVPLQTGENSIFPGISVVCEIIDKNIYIAEESVNKKLTFYLLDYDKIKGRTVLHSRRFGDRIQLCGRSHSSSVKKLINSSVPPDIRSTLHFIDDEDGIILAEGIGISQRVAPDASSLRLLRVCIHRS